MVQIPQGYDEKAIKNESYVTIEPIINKDRCICIYKDGNVDFYDTKNKQIKNDHLLFLKKEFAACLFEQKNNIVFDGFLYSQTNSKLVARNGNKTLIDKQEHYHYLISDMIFYEDWCNKKSKHNFIEMRNRLEDLHLDIKSGFIHIVPSETIAVSQIEDFLQHYNNEGAIIKRQKGKYKFGTNPSVMKIKKRYTDSLKVVGFKEGKKNILDCIVVKYNQERLYIKEGFSIEERMHIWSNRREYRGKLAIISFSKKEDGKLIKPYFVKWE